MKKKKKEKKLPILLLEDLVNLGQRGEVVLVKPGYFSYLIAQGKAVLATRKKLEKELKPFVLEEKIKNREKEVQKLKTEIENLVLEFRINQYASKVTKEKIIKTLKEKGINISKNQINFGEKIDHEGEYNIEIKLGLGISANLRVKVIKG